MDEQTASALLYRITQLENKIQRAMDFVSETETNLFPVKGTLKDTKGDFEHLRSFCK